MTKQFDRREFMKLAGLGSAVFVSSIAGMPSLVAAAEKYAGKKNRATGDFYFVQLSDSHWGFQGPAVNPDAEGTLKKAVAAVNALSEPPDFIIFTGDLTHTTDDSAERRKRMTGFRDIVKDLKVRNIRYMPGEHDASLDHGEAFKEFFGETHYTFDHKGVHFITLDNVSDPKASLGDEQIAWLAADLAKLDKNQRIVVFAHRPLFDLAPAWDWATPDGAKATDLLMPFPNVTVFYGHIHQENHHMTGHIAHHAAKSLIFPLPAPGSQPKRTPLPWNAAEPYRGLGFRGIEEKTAMVQAEVTEYPVPKA